MNGVPGEGKREQEKEGGWESRGEECVWEKEWMNQSMNMKVVGEESDGDVVSAC